MSKPSSLYAIYKYDFHKAVQRTVPTGTDTLGITLRCQSV